MRCVFWSACEHPIPAFAVLAGAEIVGVFEVHGVDRPLRDERVDHKHRRRRLLERLQLFRIEADVLVLVDLVPSRLFARHDAVDRALEAHLDPGPAFRVQEMEGDAL